MRYFGCALCFSCAILGIGAETNDLVTVNVSFGGLTGNALHGVDEYLGIPFAQSPVGNLRFMAPADWSEPYGASGRIARRWGSRCMQEAVDEAKIAYDENCLFMNVWSPRVTQDRLLPVMFYIHGGSFLFGAGDMFNSTDLALATNCVVVNINYRLGAFGFVELGLEHVGANVGLLDQQAALRWFSREAKAFRGDADNVLLFGESAGAISVGLHLVIPSSKGLFQRVLAESGAAVALSKTFVRKSGDHLSELVNCSKLTTRLSCLQNNVTAEELLNAATAMLTPLPGQGEIDVPWGFFASVDGFTIPADPMELIRSGKSNPVAAAIVGHNHDEAFAMCCSDPTTGEPVDVNTSYFLSTTTKLLNAHGQKAMPGDAEKLMRAYVPSARSQGDLSQALGDMEGDSMFACKSRAMLRALAQSGTTVHKYVFNHRGKYDPSPASWGVYHSSELPFVFGTNESGSMQLLPNMTSTERRLLATMRDLWGSFAKGKAATKTGERWPEYNASLDNHLMLETGFPTLPEGHGFHSDYCDVWDDIWGYNRQPKVVFV